MKAGAPADGLPAIAALVRAQDPDRYLTALFAPALRREGLFALYAFNQAVARTAEAVSQPLLGQIRLQWWRDQLDALYAGRTVAHEVLTPLGAAIADGRLSRGHFEALLEGRERDLDEGPVPDLAALEAYAEATSAPLVLLALEQLGAGGDAAAEAGRRVGIAWALTGLLRAVPHHARRRRVWLPADLLAAAGLGAGDLYTTTAPAGLASAVAPVAAAAGSHLAAARRLRRAVPRAALPALLPARLASLYLARLAKAGHDPFALAGEHRPPLAPLLLTLSHLRGRF